MATKYLGQHFDIHTGGVDHVAVHHTNEIAQSEAAFGHKWVNFWMHNEFLADKSGEKMAKSTGEFLRLKTIIDKGYSPLDYRYYLLTGHYRSPLSFSWEGLDSAKNSLCRAKIKIADIKKAKSEKRKAEGEKLKAKSLRLKAEGEKYLEQFKRAIDDDLNTAVALSILWKTLDAEDLNGADKIELMKKYDEVFGLDLLKEEKEEIPAEIKELAEKRLAARKAGDWAQSDKLRDEISNKGYEIKDFAGGYEVSKQ
jgi:cysteinyl-tRNA synthetase